MSRARESPSGAILNVVHRFQSNVSVRAAEAAFIVVTLGGFYLIALLRLVDPYSLGLTYRVLDTIPIGVQVVLTVVVPFVVVVLEWLSALALLRRESDSRSWTADRRIRYLLEATSVDRTTAAFVYLPLLPVAFFWALVALIHQKPYWLVPAVIGLIDACAIVAVNRYIH